MIKEETVMKYFRALIAIFLFCIFCTGCEETGYTTYRGTYAESTSGAPVIVLERGNRAEYVFLKDKSDGANLFNALDTGDRIELKTVLVTEVDGVSWADAFQCRKLNGASAEALSQEHIDYINLLAESIKAR